MADRVSQLPMPAAITGDEASPQTHIAGWGEQEVSFIDFITGLSRLLSEGADLDTLLAQSLVGMVNALPGSICAGIYLKPDNGDRLTLAAQYQQPVAEGMAHKTSADLAAQVVEYVKPITLMVRPATDAPFAPILGLPISVANRTFGALIIKADTRIYNDGDTALLKLVAAQLALALENERLRHELADQRSSYLPTGDGQDEI